MTQPVSLQDRFAELEDILNLELVERRQEIRAAELAIIAGVHIFYLGARGVAKSLLVDRLQTYISGVRKQKKLMTRFTTPEEVNGPISLTGILDDKFIRNIEGYLPTVELAFYDEGFKANSSILNSLLMAINERQYEHGNTLIDIPLATMFIASNELPQDESLAALYDRLLFRFEVQPIRDASNFSRMLKTVRPENPTPIISWGEILVAQKEAAAVVIPDAVIDALVGLRRDLREKGIEPSDRRFVEFLKVVRADAWLQGLAVADVENLQPARHVFWDIPEQQGDVDDLVLKIANPFINETRAFLKGINALEAQLDKLAADDPDKQRKGTELSGKLRKSAKELADLEKRAGASSRRNEAIAEVKDRLRHVTNRALKEIFNLDPDAEL